MKRTGEVLFDLVTWLGSLILAGLAAASFLVLAHMPLDSRNERMQFYFNGPVFWGIFVALVLFFFLAGRILLKMPSRLVFLLTVLFWCGCALYIIFRLPAVITDDAGMIRHHALKFLDGDYIGVTDGYYLSFYPYQLTMLTLEVMLYRFTTSLRVLFLCNAGFVLMTHFFSWRIAARLFRGQGERGALAEKYAILFSIAFLPLLLTVTFVYGFVPGLCFFEASVLGFLHFLREEGRLRRLLSGALCAVSLFLAWMIKPNFIVAAIAYGMILLFLFLRDRKKEALLLILAGALIMTVGSRLFYDHYRRLTGVDFGNGAPFILTMAEGLMPEQNATGRRGGWYNGYEYDTYEALGYDEASSAAAGWAKLGEMAGYWAKRPAEAMWFFGIKILSTWCDPLFDTVWQGPLVDTGAVIEDPILESLYGGDYVYLFFEKWMNVMLVLIYAGACLYFAGSLRKGKERRNPAANLVLLFFTGGFGYHLIAETKSLYAYIYVFCLIPFMADTFAGFVLMRRRRNEEHSAETV